MISLRRRHRSGSDAPSKVRRFIRVLGQPRSLAWLVAIDLLTKWLAYAFVPTGIHVPDNALFQLALAVNHSGMGSRFAHLPGDQLKALGTVAVALLWTTATLWFVTRVRPTRLPLLACAVTYMVSVVVAALALPQGLPGVSPTGNVVFLRFATAVFFSTLWWVVTVDPWRVALLFLAGAAVGNFLSLCLPPFGVVDFIYSRPINWAFNLEIFNLADLYWVISLVLAASFVLRWFYRRLRLRGT